MFYVVGIIAFMDKGMTGTVLNVVMKFIEGLGPSSFLGLGKTISPTHKSPISHSSLLRAGAS